jgi:hypothetical protein
MSNMRIRLLEKNIKLTFTVIGYNCQQVVEYYFQDPDDCFVKYKQCLSPSPGIYITNIMFTEMLSEKFNLGYLASFKKSTDISLIMGSNDIIDEEFFIQAKSNFRANSQQMFGISRSTDTLKNFSLFLDVNNKSKLDVQNARIWNLQYDDKVTKFSAGILGFNRKLYTNKWFLYTLLNYPTTESFNEIAIENFLSDQGKVKFPTTNEVFYLNIKTGSEDLTECQDDYFNNIPRFSLLPPKTQRRVLDSIQYYNQIIIPPELQLKLETFFDSYSE